MFLKVKFILNFYWFTSKILVNLEIQLIRYAKNLFLSAFKKPKILFSIEVL